MITINARGIRVVDVHVHIFPDEMTKDRESWLLRDSWFAQLYSNPKARLANIDDLLESMDLAGVDHSIVCGFPWSDNDLCRLHNEYMAESARLHPGRISWLGIVTPGGKGDASLANECFEQGAVGLGEFNADAQGFRWAERASFSAVAEVAIQHGRPVLVHCSEPVGHLYPGKGTAVPSEIVALATEHLELKIVAAHWGGGLPFYELMPSVRPMIANVSYDSGATSYLYDHSVFGHVIEIAGPEKVLFASDFPVLGQKRLIERMTTMAWPTEKSIDQVMHGNAERLFGIEATT